MSTAIMKNGNAPAANPFLDKPTKSFDSQLNPRYNFENYCNGSSNQIARTIAESIANDPTNKTFNPLFIFGPTGVGKTHLIQAVGIRIKENNPSARVLYVTARFFQSQYTAANHKGQINNFFHFYQSIDTLIIDDVQDLAGKPETQNTFFHIFNQLHQNNRQIILSSDCAPSEMDGFEARLLSRFKWGAAAELDRPDTELRRKVLIKKAQQDGLDLPADVIEYVAENVTDSIRELEGVVASLVAHATVLNCEITVDLARTVVANAIRIKRRQVNFEMVTQAVCSYYKLEPDTMFTKSRKREISDARQMVMYLSKKLAGMSLKNIGNKLGRTHATVIYACRNIEERLSIDKELRTSLDSIHRLIENN
jgi:chromosomal replication initiator protein